MDTYKSINVSTGMLEDTEEIRQVAADLAQALQVLLANPILGMLVPPPVLHDMIVYAVKAESLVRFMTQREEYYLLNKVAGTPPEVARQMEALVGELSDVHPSIHPEVRGQLLQNILSNPGIPDNIKEHARIEYENTVKAVEKIELPESLENFLKGLAERDKQGG